mmetsp:Transcript_58845/g.162708  ORF Transcript_58845/g.162708 Transcript_58845/m.162708 type:complete len:376 (-) Transcript_58845:80-1207(-)
MAACGYYLAKKGIVTPQNKKVLAKISAELTIPALLFTSILACNQDWSTDDCPDVMQAVSSGWILLFLPFWNVGWGMLIGWLGAKISKAPPEFQMSSMVAVAFGNATGLPITLLTVIHSSFGKNTGLGDVDPTLYLSVYLLFNPVLQWTVGRYLLSQPPPELADQPFEPANTPTGGDILKESLLVNTMPDGRLASGDVPPTSVDEGLDMCALDTFTSPDDVGFPEAMVKLRRQMSTDLANEPVPPEEPGCLSNVWETAKAAIKQAAQPTVLGALAGIVVSAIPGFREIFIDTDDRDDDAPMEWFFNGLAKVGAAAVPINMIILGTTLSKGADLSKMPLCPSLMVVFGKMVVMPLIGVATALGLRAMHYRIDDKGEQ